MDTSEKPFAKSRITSYNVCYTKLLRANTTDDRTYYYEVFPSNNLELAIWMESERLMHPVINQIGVDTQNEVVKEEKRLRVDNQPYGNLIKAVV